MLQCENYLWMGGAIGKPAGPVAVDIFEDGPSRTCFCWLRCASSICARSISKINGAKSIADELKISQVAVHERE